VECADINPSIRRIENGLMKHICDFVSPLFCHLHKE
jgi:hypothetical protein